MAYLLAVCWRRYLIRLNERPLETKAITAGTLSAASDVIAQVLTAKEGVPYNWRRTIAFGLLGFVYNGPSMHYWQNMMERAFARYKPGLPLALAKTTIDQLTYGPFCNALFIVFYAKCVEGASARETLAKLKRDYVTVQLKAWTVWPAAALVNYVFIPVPLRVLFVNLVGLGWGTLLSLQASSASQPKAIV